MSVVVRTLAIGSWNCSFVTQVGFQNCCFFACCLYKKKEKTKRKEKKTNKRILDLSIVWEPNLEVLAFEITFMLDYDLFPIAPLFLCCLSTYPCAPHFVLNSITTLKSPFDLDLHVFWFLIWEACQVHLMLVFQRWFESK